MKKPFGNSGAAIRLAELVEEDKNSRRYVSSTLSELGSTLGGIYFVRNDRVRRALCDLVKKDYLVKISSSVIPDKTKSYLRNVVITKCRAAKRTFDTDTYPKI